MLVDWTKGRSTPIIRISSFYDCRTPSAEVIEIFVVLGGVPQDNPSVVPNRVSPLRETRSPSKKCLSVLCFLRAPVPRFRRRAAFESAGEKRSIVASAFVQHMNQRAHGISGHSSPPTILPARETRGDTPREESAGGDIQDKCTSGKRGWENNNGGDLGKRTADLL